MASSNQSDGAAALARIIAEPARHLTHLAFRTLPQLDLVLPVSNPDLFSILYDPVRDLPAEILEKAKQSLIDCPSVQRRGPDGGPLPLIILRPERLGDASHPQDAYRRFWRSMNIHREAWGELPAQIILCTDPFNGNLLSEYARDLLTWLMPKLDLGIPLPANNAGFTNFEISRPDDDTAISGRAYEMQWDSLWPRLEHRSKNGGLSDMKSLHLIFTLLRSSLANQRLDHARALVQLAEPLKNPALIKIKEELAKPQPDKNRILAVVPAEGHIGIPHGVLSYPESKNPPDPPGILSYPESSSKPNNLPYRPMGARFKGRNEDMCRLHEALSSGEHRAGIGMTPARAATHGLGGIGKTRLACEYGHTHAEHYDALLFVNAASAEALDRSVGELADTIGPVLGLSAGADDGAKKDAVEQWLRTNDNFLLILDNIDDEATALAVKTWLAKMTKGHVILTGRISTWPKGIKKLPIEVLSTEAAADYLMEDTEQNAGDTEAKKNALAIATELGGLALLLGQASAYINNEGLTLAEYLAHWKEKHEACLTAWNEIENDITGPERPYGCNTFVTWMTTVEQLDTPARELLEKCAWFAPDPIPEWILGEDKEALNLLVRSGMATRHRDAEVAGDFGRGFVLHRIVQDVTRQRLRSEGRADEVCLAAIEWVADLFRGAVDEVANWPKFDPLAAHALQLARRAETAAAPVTGEEKAGDPPPAQRLAGRLYWHLAGWTSSHGRYAEAVDWGRRGVARLERALGAEHADTLTCRSNLGEDLRLLGKYEEAEAEHRAVLVVRERTLGAKDPKILISRNNLVIVLAEQGKRAEAEAEHREVLAVLERVLGAEHRDTLGSRNNLAAALNAQGKFAEALDEHQAVRAVRQRVLGDEHPETLTSQYNVAAALKNLGRTEEALAAAEIAYAGRRKVLGEEHPETLKAQGLVERLREG